MDLLKPGYLLDYENDDDKLRYEAIENGLRELSTEHKSESSKKVRDNRFIGGHPISLTTSNIEDMGTSKYIVCEKTDGVRYIMIILSNNEVYLHSRNTGTIFKSTKQYFLTSIQLAKEYEQTDEMCLSIKYVFDGELVIDTKSNQQKVYYLIFDTLCSFGNSVIKYDYLSRLNQATKFIRNNKVFKRIQKQSQKQYSPVFKQFLIEKLDEQLLSTKIRIKLKDFFEIEDIEYLQNVVVPKLEHGNDGLIFTSNKQSYIFGKNPDILKWKPSHLITIDFLMIPNVKLKQMNRFRDLNVVDLYVSIKNENALDNLIFDFMVVDDSQFAEINQKIQQLRQQNYGVPVLGVVGECSFDFQKENHFIYNILEDCSDIEEVLQFYQDNAFIMQHELYRYEHFGKQLEFYQSNTGNWTLDRYRMDKSDPNALLTASNVSETIKQNITFEVLKEKINQIQTQKQKMRQQTQDLSMIKKIKY